MEAEASSKRCRPCRAQPDVSTEATGTAAILLEAARKTEAINNNPRRTAEEKRDLCKLAQRPAINILRPFLMKGLKFGFMYLPEVLQEAPAEEHPVARFVLQKDHISGFKDDEERKFVAEKLLAAMMFVIRKRRNKFNSDLRNAMIKAGVSGRSSTWLLDSSR